MKQYLLAVHHDSEAEHNGDEMSPETLARMYKQVDEFNKELAANNLEVFAGGLHAPSSATVVRLNDDKTETFTTDGPYAETKEQLGGFWVVKAPDLDAALELARKAALACEGPVEVRPFQEEIED